MPSKYEAHVRRRRSDVLKNRQNFSDWSMTPLQHQHGIVTPNGLFFERHHAGTPDIDPAKHKLVIHGMVKQPLEFTMDALMRYPAVSRFYSRVSGTVTEWPRRIRPCSRLRLLSARSGRYGYWCSRAGLCGRKKARVRRSRRRRTHTHLPPR